MRARRTVHVITLCVLTVALLCLLASARPFVQPAFARQPAQRAAQGSGFALLVKPDGTLWACGDNSHGQLGLGDRSPRLVTGQVGHDRDWVAVACGAAHSLAVKADGSLWSWGAGSSGQLGTGDRKDRDAPVRVGNGTRWVAVAAGGSFSLALRADGSLWSWGANGSGQLGVGGRAARLSPRRVRGAGRWVAVACGQSYVLALKADGSLWSWGDDRQGQLGLGDRRSRSTPRRVGASRAWRAVSCGASFAAAVRSNGTLWTWGANGDGQLGLGGHARRLRPKRVGKVRTWRAVACGRAHVAALRRNGTLWTWGDDRHGQLGLGDRVDRGRPVRVAGGSWTAVTCGGDSSTASRSDLSRWAWGDDRHGQLGLGDLLDRRAPVRAMFLDDVTAPSVDTLMSTTHPDPDRSYADATPVFSWSASDRSGIAGYGVSLDASADGQAPEAPTMETTTSFPGTGDGTWYFHVRAVDGGGNWGPTRTTTVRIDTTPPVTSDNAPGGWSPRPVTVTLAAGDPGGSGAQSTQYKLDGALAWSTGTSVTVSGDGVHTIVYRSVDNAGNVEADKSCQVRIDATAPLTSDNAPGGWSSKPVTVALTSSDAGGSGVRSTQYRLDSAGWTIYSTPVRVVGDGAHTLVYRSTDNAGNVEAEKSRQVRIDSTPPQLTGLRPADGAMILQGGGGACAWMASDALSGIATEGATVDGVATAAGAPVDGLAAGVHTLVVSASDGAGNTATSSTQFTITRPVVTVTAPNGGETLVQGATKTVTWRLGAPPACGSFDVLVGDAGGQWSKLDGAHVAVVSGQVAYSYNWTVDASPGSGYRIRVQYSLDGGGTVASDDSDGTFTVTAPPATPTALGLTAVGRYAYVADGSAGLLVYDVLDPAAPVLVATCDTPGNASDVTVIGDYAYVADGVGGLAVVDVGDPLRPTYVESLAMPGAAERLDVSQGVLLDGFESLSGWSGSNATLSLDHADVKQGGASLDAVIPAGATGSLMKDDLGWDLSRDPGSLQVWVKLTNVGIPPLTQNDQASLRIYLSNGDDFTNVFYTGSNFALHEGWNLLRFSALDWKTMGSPSWSSPIQRVAFDIPAPADWSFAVDFDDLRTAVTGRQPAFLWTFDDGYDEVYTDVLPYLSAHGQSATMYVRPDYVDGGGDKITLAHLNALYGAGWAVANHTIDHTDLTSVDGATAEEKITAGYDWLMAHGFTRAARHLAYPLNAVDDDAMAAALGAGVLSARGGWQRSMQLPVDESLELTSFDFDDTSAPTVDLWQRRIDRAIATGSAVICGAHKFDAITLPVFQGTVDYLAAHHVWTPTIDQWWNTMVAQSDSGDGAAGQYLYVACGAGGVQAVDISDPASPSLAGRCATPGIAHDVAVDGEYAYVAAGSGGLRVLDISRPATPVLAGQSAATDARGVAVRQDIAYVADRSAGLRAVDVSKPVAPVALATLPLSGTPSDVAVDGDTAYVAAGAAGVDLVDVGDPSAPVSLGARTMNGQATALVVFGGHVYVAAGTAGLQTASAR